MRNRLKPRRLAFTLAALLLACASLAATPASDDRGIFPLDQIEPGMKGVAYTIFSGDQVESMDVEVIGVLHNALGPKQDVILVQLLGAKAEHSGVVAGMSGSPVYFNGKLAGALSLKLGTFTKEAIGGVTPIASMYDIDRAIPAEDRVPASSIAPPPTYSASLARDGAASFSASVRVPLSTELSHRAGLDAVSYLVPIETPLVFSGVYPQTLAQFGSQLNSLGMSAMVGGTATPSPEDAKIKPGDMVGFELVGGDLSLESGCTVTAIIDDRVYACGHPLFGFGSVSFPLTRAHVVTTLNSSMASTKIISTGGVIGTLTQDRTTAVMGRLGPAPAMIPLDVSISTPSEEKEFHFDVAENRQVTPFLVAIAIFNGISGNTAYTEGSTLQLTGSIDLAGHSSVNLENLFAPTDAPLPSAAMVSLNVQSIFDQIYTNPFEAPHVHKIMLHVTSVPDRRWASIEGAWSEKSEVEPGETVRVKVMLRPYRGAPFIQELPVTVPPQASHGPLQLLVSDADTLNRMSRPFGAPSELPGLEELIHMLNRERHNDQLYATLLQPTPTLLVEDKELPNVPLSEINVLDRKRSPGSARLLWESAAGEWSVPMNQVIVGQRSVTITVK